MKIAINGEILEVSGGGLPEGAVPVMPLTKAEYDALTDEEKQAGVVYAITDDAGSGGGSGGSSEEIYSAEETRIGTWIDGKPLYRRVFVRTVPSFSTGIPSEFLKYSEELEIVHFRTRIKRNNGYALENNFISTLSQYWYQVYDYVPGHAIVINGAPNVSTEITGSDAVIELEYTKTTDTGGAA